MARIYAMKVFVVDDDPTLRMLMCELLRSDLRCETLEASDGLEAWEILNSGLIPDLLIVDVRMPKMGGLELVSRLRANRNRRGQKVMLCSTVNDRATIVRAAHLGINGYLLKPFMAGDFVMQLRRLCENPAPSATALEPLDLVLGRLGSGKRIYLDLLGVFTRNVEDFITRFRAGAESPNRNDLVLRLGAIEGAARSLGAQGLAAAALKLEHSLLAEDALAAASAIEMLESENERVIAAAGCISYSHGFPASQVLASDSKAPAVSS